MTTTVVSDGGHRAFWRRWWEISRRVTEGSISREDAARILQFAIEGKGIETSYTYSPDYRNRTAQEQLEFWLRQYPDLDSSHVRIHLSSKILRHMEGLAVIPKPAVFGGYTEALAKMNDLLASTRPFKNWRQGELTQQQLSLVHQTRRAHLTLDNQPGDFWMFSFQFGMRYAMQSAWQVEHRLDVSGCTEFCCGPYEAAALLCTHPDRITGVNQLGIDCPGVYYTPRREDGEQFSLHYYRSGQEACLAMHHDSRHAQRNTFGVMTGKIAVMRSMIC